MVLVLHLGLSDAISRWYLTERPRSRSRKREDTKEYLTWSRFMTYPSESVANRSYLAEDCTKSLLFRSRSHSALRPCRKRRRPKLSPFSRKSAFSKDAGPTKAKVRWLTRADNGPRFTGRLPRRTHRRSLRTQTSGVGEMRLLFCS
jgi:hypothetical protein